MAYTVLTMKTYKDVINLIEVCSGQLYVAVIYATDRHEWLPVDKTEYLRQLRMIGNPEECPYPCYFEVDKDGEMFIHPKTENVA